MLKTQKLVFIASLGALSFVLMLLNFPILPGADFLKLDFSALPILFGLVIFGWKGSLAILVLRSALKLLLDNGGVAGMIGLPMNMVALAIFVLAFALVWNRKRTVGNFIKASILGTLGLTLAMVALNYVYGIPLYASLANFDIAAYIGLKPYIYGMVIPFNLLQGMIFAVSFGLLKLPMQPILEKYSYEK